MHSMISTDDRFFLSVPTQYRLSFTFQDCGQTGTLLAGLLDAPQATFASKVDRGDDGSFTVERETDSGKVRHHARLDYLGMDDKLLSFRHCPCHRNHTTYIIISHALEYQELKSLS